MANNKFSDVVVRLTGSLPNVSIGLGIPLILVKTADTSDSFVPKLKKFYSLDEINADYTSGTDVNTVAKTIFDQEARPDHVSVLEFKTLPNDLTTFWNEDWTFALLATPNASDAAALSMAVEQVGFKFAVVQVKRRQMLQQSEVNCGLSSRYCQRQMGVWTLQLSELSEVCKSVLKTGSSSLLKM